MDLAIKVSNLFIKKMRDNNWQGVREFYIGEENSDFTTIRLFSNGELTRIVFKKKLSGAYFVYTNGKLDSCCDIDFFESELYYLEKFGEKILDKLLSTPTNAPVKNEMQKNQNIPTKKQKIVTIKVKSPEEKSIQIDRLLDKYNRYQTLFNQTNDQKYLRRKEQLMRLLKKAKKSLSE